MDMEVVEGTIGHIGREAWPTGESGGKVSALEVGHRRLKGVVLPSPMPSVLVPGKFARLLVQRGLTQGVVTAPVVVAAEIDGKTYKARSVLVTALIKVPVWMMAVVTITAISPVIGIAVGSFIIGYYAKNYLDYRRF